VFRITTWGESHGKAIGVVIDGCPAGIPLTVEEIHEELLLRRPGRNAYATSRTEEDFPEIISGVFEGVTTGAPLAIMIYNQDADPRAYAPIKHLLRPGHAQFTYQEKYGVFDDRGGGRASARETAARVAAGAVAKKLLSFYQIKLVAYIKEVGGIVASSIHALDVSSCKKQIVQDPLFCPDPVASALIARTIEEVKKEGDSLGGIVELVAVSLPVGLGDPMYEKLEACLAKAMLSLPASKGIEFGAGFQAARMKGSEHNDAFVVDREGKVATKSNHAGGTLGGISTGMPLILRVAFKPPSSIRKPQETLDIKKEPQEFVLPEGSRHDPCVAVRAVPVVEAMAALVLADAVLMNRSARINL